MRVTWRYTCDFGHSWVLFREETSAERPEDLVCQHGHPAVTLLKERPADLIGVLCRPSALEDGVVTGKIYGEGYYRLVLLNREGTEERTSLRSYPWHEIVKLAERFAGRAREHAVRMWDVSPP
jgi:hypothetical protein